MYEGCRRRYVALNYVNLCHFKRGAQTREFSDTKKSVRLFGTPAH